ncbi:MAG: hypothetical protein HWN68_06430 [Desulfobacterales bacterium]|nr:hypothetical protein [Desulfobacterales bacterium]
MNARVGLIIFGILTYANFITVAYLDFGKWLLIENATLFIIFMLLDFIQEGKKARARREKRKNIWKF